MATFFKKIRYLLSVTNSSNNHVNEKENINSSPEIYLDTIETEYKPQQLKPTPLQEGENIRVVMFVQHAAVWSSWQTIYECMSEHPNFSVKIVLVPFIHPFSSVATVYDELRNLFIRNNISFTTLDYFSFDSYRPHVVFIQNPYEETRPEKIRIAEIKKNGARIVYIPYGLEVGNGSWNISAQFDTDLHRQAWRIFSRSTHHKQLFARYCSAGNEHVVVTGHPKFDLQHKTQDNVDLTFTSKLKNKIGSRKVILWTPHFSVGKPASWSTFELFNSEILEIFSQHQHELFLLIRPHPLFFKTMQSKNIWTSDDETKFRTMIQLSDHIALDEQESYHQAFALADALMADVGSFLLEFLPSSKPILYLKHPEGLGLIDEEEQLKGYYVAQNSNEIKHFIQIILQGLDPLGSLRKDNISHLLFGLDGKAGQRVAEHIASALSVSDFAQPEFQKTMLLQEENRQKFDKELLTFILEQENTPLSLAKKHKLIEVIEKIGHLDSLIDTHCQNGFFLSFIKNYFNSISAYDVSQEFVNYASNNFDNSNINYMVGTVEQIHTFERYDVVLCVDLLSNIFDDLELIKIMDKLNILIKPNGYLVIMDSYSTGSEQIKALLKGCSIKYRCFSDYTKLLSARNLLLQSTNPIWHENNIETNISIFRNKSFLGSDI